MLGIYRKINGGALMAEVKVLIEGYTSSGSGQERTCPTITLVRDKGIVMVVDPGVVEDQKQIVDALRKEGLKVSDVNYVCLTHSHADHYMNAGMFPAAKKLEFYGVWDGNKCLEWKEQFTKDIRIIKTPGHSFTGITLLVKTGIGTIAVCGDVFWVEGGPAEDPYADDVKKLEESRKLVLKQADYIIPGHAGMYKAKK